MKQTQHQQLLDPVKSAVRHRHSRGDTQRLAGQASLTEKLVVAQNADDCFIAVSGGHHEFYLALVEIPHGIRSVSLREDRAIGAEFENGFATRDSGEKCCPIDSLSLLVCCRKRGLAFAAGQDTLRMGLVWGHNNLATTFPF